MIRGIIIFFKVGLSGLGVLLLIYFLTAIVLSIIPKVPNTTICNQDSKVYVSSNGVHLDFIIPTDILPPDLYQQLDLSRNTTHVVFGWGDRDFYINTPTWNDLKFSTAFKALFMSTESAMHVVEVEHTRSRWKQLNICHHQVDLLNQYIVESFRKSADGSFIEIPATSYGDRDKFYEATGRFNCLQTCNHWVNNGLKAAQLPAAIWSPFDQGVLYQLRKASTTNSPPH